MTKQMKISLAILGALLALAAVFAVLNLRGLDEKKAAAQAQAFTIVIGEEKTTVTIEDMQTIGIRDIPANYKPSGKAPVERIYQGVPFVEVLTYKGISPADYKTVVFTAADGYSTAISAEEALDPEKCVIATGLAGAPLEGKEAGTTSLMMILPKDQFSQRWCKFLLEASAE